MGQDTDEDRIRQKAHELWEAEGRPHGRDADHWIQAREIIAIRDSMDDTLLPRDTGEQEPIENPNEALRNLADFPNLTDQGENLLTSTDRETTSGDMPTIEVPTSDQPGIPSSKPSEPSGTANSSGTPAQPVSADATTVQPNTASVPKVAAAKPAPAKAQGKSSTSKGSKPSGRK